MDEAVRTEDYINLTLPVKEMLFEQKEKLFSWEGTRRGMSPSKTWPPSCR
jgi:hypothetical protein